VGNSHKNPAPEWLTEKSWNEIVEASEIKGLENFRESFVGNLDEWKNFYDLSNPEENPFPVPFEKAEDFERLIILKCLRADKIVHAVKQFIVDKMGQEFIEPPQFNLQASYEDSNPTTPLIFILSPGADPIENLFAFAKEQGIFEK
jgi:dynein heavy chain